MNKKTRIIISLIISIIALIYMLLGYYGIIRYFHLHNRPIEYYSSRYKSVPKAEKNRVIVSFTTTGEEINKLRPFINSILDQTARVDDIALTIPYKDIHKVPETLKKVLSVYGISKDYEDANNLIPAVLREPESDTKIIIVEPYMIYGIDFISDMVEASNSNSEKIIYGNYGITKSGILVKPKFFDTTVSDYEKGIGCCKWIEKCCNNDKKIIGCPKTYKVWK